MKVQQLGWILVLLLGLPAAAQESVIDRDLRGLYPGEGTLPPHDIVEISDTVDGLMVVAFNPIMREVPNVLIYRVTEGGLERVMEGLTLGIQLEPSARTDLHTEGMGVDTSFAGPQNTATGLQLAHESGFQTIDYGRFIHMHVAADTKFFLDKRMFEDLRTTLLDPEETLMEGEPAETCILYDMPSLEALNFEKRQDSYVITGETANFQRWQVTFSGVDAAGRLVDKRVSAEQLSPAAR